MFLGGLRVANAAAAGSPTYELITLLHYWILDLALATFMDDVVDHIGLVGDFFLVLVVFAVPMGL